MISLLIGALTILLVLWILQLILARMQLPGDIQQIVLVVVGVVLLLGLIGHGLYDPLGTGWGWR